MLKNLIAVAFIITPLFVLSQRISGTVYDADEILTSVQIINRTQNIVAFTDDNGNFLIPAKLNDSISFTSRLHHPYKMKVEAIHFEDVFVVELKKIINDLDEVYLENQPKTQPFTQETYNSKFQEQLLNDRKSNPEKYSGVGSGNMDFIAIANMIAGLFKSKKPKPNVLIPITAKNLDSLFAKDRFFNEALLRNDLKIEKDLQGLFFDYCETRQINAKLLDPNQQLVLLSELMEAGSDFNKMVAEARKED